jgi:hypothetical protein
MNPDTERERDIVDCIRRALSEVKTLVQRAFEEAGGTPVPGSALDQAGLREGEEIVLDYLVHDEWGLALEHLIYMIEEPELVISRSTYELIERAGHAMSMSPALWEQLPVRPRSLKEHLLAMPPVGDDADFERLPDLGRDEEL